MIAVGVAITIGLAIAAGMALRVGVLRPDRFVSERGGPPAVAAALR
jgi:hypothetical protein